jgi:hypothetical protein
MLLSTITSKESSAPKSLWYAAAAAAIAGLAAPTAEAQIVYQDIDPDVTVQDTGPFGDRWIDAFPIDFDGDGNAEIAFGEVNDMSYTCARLNEDRGDGTDGDFVVGIVGEIFQVGGFEYAYFLPLEAGSTISSFNAGVLGYYTHLATFTYETMDAANWLGAGDKYIGLLFQLDGGDRHFGWIRAEMPEPGQIIVKDYAYESEPFTPIAAGNMGTVSNEDGAPLVGSHRLSAAYPNPFNADARFHLEVARTQDVTVELFDVLGRSVQVLHAGALTAGTDHEFAIRGAELPNGVYLVRAVGEEFKDTHTVTLSR